MARSGRGRGEVRFNALGNVGFAGSFRAVGALGRELGVADGAFVLFRNLRG